MQLVFADSEVAGIDVLGDGLRVRFAAAAVEPSGGSGEAGYLLDFDLLLQGATWTGDPAACFGRLVDGWLSDSVSRLTRLELPFDGPGPWDAVFAFPHGVQLAARASHVTAVPRGDQRFRPSYAC